MTPQDKIVSLPTEWPYRLLLNSLILGVIFALGFITMIIKTDFMQHRFNNLANDFYNYTKEIGFTLDDIIVEGREKTKLQEIIDLLNLNHDTNVLSLNIYDIKQSIETLPWIKSAVVTRSFFPNIIRIKITERQVKSLWQMQDNFYPIDTDGNVINAEFKATQPMLLIVGQGAPENIAELLQIIQEDDAIFKRIKVANFISERRWNLVLDDIKNGVTIKLPEENTSAAWKKFLKLNTTKGLLKRKLTIIDLRLEDKVIVKLKKTSKEDLKLNDAKESKEAI